jgi:hypothetical protein
MAIVAGCKTEPGQAALHARIVLEPTQKATCVVMKVQTPAGESLAEEKRLDRGAGKDSFSIAIFKGTLPDEIEITAQPYYSSGGGCAAPLSPNGELARQTGRFPLEGSDEVTVALAAPPASLDGDRDGFAGGSGPDCADDNAARRPDATEVCAGTVDLNCNGKIGCEDPACPGQQCPAPPAAIAFKTAPQTLPAGACSGAVTIEARNASDQPLAVATTTQVVLTAPTGAGITFHSNPACTDTAVGNVPINSGATNVTIYFKGTAAGLQELTATVEGVTPAKQTHTINPAAPSAIRFRSGEQSVQLGQCSGQVTVELVDAFNNLTTSSSGLTVMLADNLPIVSDFTFHATNTCTTTSIGSVAINASAGTQTFYFKGAKVGPVDVTVSSTGLTSATQQQTILPGPPNKLAFSTGPHTVGVFLCSPANRLQIQDAGSNASPVGAATNITLSHNRTAGTMTFHTASDCSGAAVTNLTVPNTQSEATFYFRAVVIQTYTITATASSLPNPSAQQTESVVAVPPTQIRITAGPASHNADTNCSTALTVQSQDAGGNPANVSSNTTVTLTSNASAASIPANDFGFFSDAGCTTPVSTVQINSGSNSRTFYFRARVAETVTITASTSSLGDDTHDVNITRGAINKLRITSAAQTNVVAGGCSLPVTVQTSDQWDNDVPVGALTNVSLTDSPDLGAAFKFYSNSSCTTEITDVPISSGNSSATFHFRGTQAGSVTVQVSAPPLTAASQGQTIIPGAASALNFVTASQTVSVNACSGLTSVELTDSFGNHVTTPERALDLSGTPTAGITFYENPTCADPPVTQVTTVGGIANFHWKATGTGAVSLSTSSDPIPSKSQDQFVSAANLVKSGTCSMANGAASAPCTITGGPVAALSRSILFWQATAANRQTDDSAVICYFENTSTITCARNAAGGAVDVAWYVVTFPETTGVYVEHRSPASTPSITCASGTSMDVTLTQAVNATRSFVLISSRRGGNENETSHFKRAFLASDGTKVTITSSACSSDVIALQVVDFPGAVVERGSLTLSGATGGAPLTAADPARSFLLYTYQVPSGTADDPCKRAVRGYLSSNTRVDFSRGNGGCTFAESIDVTYERVQLPLGNKVQAFNETIAAAADSFNLTLPVAVEPSRAAAFASGQASSGQSIGETASTDNNINMARARMILSDPRSLILRRSTAVTTTAAQFTGYAVEFAAP